MTRHLMRAALLILSLSTPALSQTRVPPIVDSVSLQGPRVGATFLSSGIVSQLRDNQIEVGSLITQFGWQFEKQLFHHSSGLSALTEWVVLAGALEQSVAVPSLSWMVGLRSSNGTEFGIGPNVTPGGVALALAAGVTFRTGALNVPVNLAVVPSKAGMRVSVLSGFTLRR